MIKGTKRNLATFSGVQFQSSQLRTGSVHSDLEVAVGARRNEGGREGSKEEGSNSNKFT